MWLLVCGADSTLKVHCKCLLTVVVGWCGSTAATVTPGGEPSRHVLSAATPHPHPQDRQEVTSPTHCFLHPPGSGQLLRTPPDPQRLHQQPMGFLRAQQGTPVHRTAAMRTPQILHCPPQTAHHRPYRIHLAAPLLAQRRATLSLRQGPRRSQRHPHPTLLRAGLLLHRQRNRPARCGALPLTRHLRDLRIQLLKLGIGR